jgi:hypothetical protein
VQDRRIHRLEAEARGVAGGAGEIRGFLVVAVIAECHVQVAERVVTERPGRICEPVGLESAPRYDVEHAVRPVAGARGQPAAVDLQRFDILWIELRSDDGHGAARHRDAVDRPRYAVAAARVQVVVQHVGAG